MSRTANDLFAHAFFDAPGLLAVRFRGHAAAEANVTSWAYRRQADPGGTSWTSAVPVVFVGLVFGMIMMPTCSSSPRPPVTLSAGQDTDAAGRTGWEQGLLQLADDLGPTRAELQPFVVRTLLDVPRELENRGDATGGWLRPGLAEAERQAHARASRLRREPDLAEAGTDLAVILDLPGPQTIAAGAALALRGDPVPTFDNLPHPRGVVPSSDTLAAAVAWSSTYRQARAARTANVPALFLLDGERLRVYNPADDRFDNRSHARLPSVAAWKALGVKRIIYVREHAGDVAERDDLNELFVALAEAGIAIRHVGLDRFAADTPATRPVSGRTHISTGALWRQPWMGLPHADDDYRSPRRAPQPASTGTFDGGQSQHDRIISRLARPADSATSGGSWGRSSSSSNSG